MLKKVICAFLTGCLLFSGGVWAQEETKSTTFVDDLGRTVTVNEPRRTAALLSSFAHIWMLAGGEIVAAPDDAWEDLRLDLSDDAVNLGRTKELSLELLFSVEPDFVLASVNTRQNVEWQSILESAGIPVAYFDVNGFEDYLRVLELLTGVTGRRDLYEENGLNVQKQIEEVIERNRIRQIGKEASSALIVMASASSLKVKRSEGNVLGEMLSQMEVRNIADTEEAILENLSVERICEADPDYIFFVQRGDDEEGMRRYIESTLTATPIWSQLTAVREGRVFFMDKELYNLKPNNRWGEAYEQLEEILADEEK